MSYALIALLGAANLALLVWLLLRFSRLSAALEGNQEARHRAMLNDLHEGLARQAERTFSALQEHGERLRGAVSQELSATRAELAALKETHSAQLAQSREAQQALMREFSEGLQHNLMEQARAERAQLADSLHKVGAQLSAAVEKLAQGVEARLAEISGKVAERLDQGFRNTNDTFARVMERLATIDEAQKKIDSLTSNVVTLQEILGDKRSRGAFGEVQLEALVRNLLPPTAYDFQVTLPNGSRVDCLLRLPEPTGQVAVDSKFPLENFNRMFEREGAEADRLQAQRAFKADVKKHVDDIAAKYIIETVTSDGAVMFLPAEAVFAEIHAYHPDLVEYALSRRVWLVSPTTLMAVLNTARAVIKDVETRRQVHIIKEELARLGKEFGRFDERMKKLAGHIRQAHEDAQEVHTTSIKISRRFAQIENVDLEHLRQGPELLPEGEP